MTTSTTLTLCDHTSDAGFRAWGSEFHAQMVSIGLTLTSDTGQINWTTVTRPAITVSAGYEIWRFNDTLQATTPIFIKLEYGTGGTATYPTMWITVGNGSNGSGTLTGLTSSKCQCGYSVAPLSTTNVYFSRFVYNPTLGFFGFAWKISLGVLNVCYESAFVFRSCDSTGAATSTSVQLLTNDNTVTATGKYGVMQCLNYTTSLIYPPTPATQGGYWSNHVFGQTTTVWGTSSNISVDPVFYLTPTLGVTQCLGRALTTEISVHSYATSTLVGSTAHNYLQIGYAFSSTTNYTGADAAALTLGTLGIMMLWE